MNDDDLALPKREEPEEQEDPWAMFRDVTYALTVEEIKERYKDIGILAQNRNCTVRLSIHNRTGQKVVMKILNKSSFTDPKKRLFLYREIQTLRLMGDEKHITELYEVIDSGDRIWVIMEYAAGGELFDFVKAKAPLVESQAREIFSPIVKVVAFMHSLNLVHRDLKLENVLLSTNGKIMLADFGFSRYWDPNDDLAESLCGTPHYCPPEIIKAQPYNPMYADSWCLGVILFMLLFGRCPFTGLSIPEMQKAIMEAKLVLPFNLSDLAEDLLHKLITLNPKDRLLPKEIMQHPWYNKNRMPHMKKKPDDQMLMHKTVLSDMGIKEDIPIGQIDKLDEDDQVSYKIIHRRYQLHELELPIKADHGTLNIPPMDFKPLTVRPQIEQGLQTGKRTSDCVMGMGSNRVKERLPSLDPYLRIMRVETPDRKRPKSSVRSPIRRPDAPIRTAPRGKRPVGRHAATLSTDVTSRLTFRTRQTLRLKSCEQTEEDPQLPRLNCQKTTLDPLPDLWKRLMTFIDKENISVITEKDWGLYLVINDPLYQEELCVVLNVGCVHPGFGLIGYSVYKMKGDDDDFQHFETKLNSYMGFL